MREEKSLIEKYGKETGFRVPEGYFEVMRKEVTEKLPPMEMPEPQVNRTLWEKVKPYVYLAAMFAGIWMMMNIFNRVSAVDSLNLDNPPENIAMAMINSDIDEISAIPESMSDFQLEEEVGNEYQSMEEFEKEFGYTIAPEYDNLKN